MYTSYLTESNKKSRLLDWMIGSRRGKKTGAGGRDRTEVLFESAARQASQQIINKSTLALEGIGR